MHGILIWKEPKLFGILLENGGRYRYGSLLENALCVLPSPRMLACLEQLHTQTVRWLGMAPAVLN